MDLGLDPVHRVADEAHALGRVEALDGLHQADIAFLDQVAVRQAVAQIIAGDGHDETQVRHHERAGGLQVVVVAQLGRQARLFLLCEQGQTVDGRDVGVEVAQRGNQTPRITDGQCVGGGSGHVLSLIGIRSFGSTNISTLVKRVLIPSVECVDPEIGHDASPLGVANAHICSFCVSLAMKIFLLAAAKGAPVF